MVQSPSKRKQRWTIATVVQLKFSVVRSFSVLSQYGRWTHESYCERRKQSILVEQAKASSRRETQTEQAESWSEQRLERGWRIGTILLRSFIEKESNDRESSLCVGRCKISAACSFRGRVLLPLGSIGASIHFGSGADINI